MKYKWAVFIVLLWLLPVSAFAIYDEDVLKKDYTSFLSIYLNAEFYHFNNADFLNYDQATYQANSYVRRLNTDDAVSFAYSTIGLSMRKAFKNVMLRIEIYRSGFWGNDNLEGKDNGGNGILFKFAYFTWFPSNNVNLVFGRQRFKIGDSLRDYFFYDIVDGVTVNFRPIKPLTLTFLGDILGIAAKPDSYLYSTIATDGNETDDFQGNKISFRFGFVLDYKILDLLGFKAFGFYVKFGASTNGGADRAENGNNVTNQADNDFLMTGGIRVYFGEAKISRYQGGIGLAVDFTAAFSFGKDYQFDRTREYKGLGTAVNAQLNFNNRFFILLTGGFFSGKYAGLKALSPGSLLLYSYKGYFVAPYAEAHHFKDYAKYETPKEVDKTFPKSFSLLQVKFDVKKWIFAIYGMALWETADRAYMGTDVQFSIEKKFDFISFKLVAGVFFPSGYYAARKDIYTYLPVGTDPFYGIALIVTVKFDMFRTTKLTGGGESGGGRQDDEDDRTQPEGDGEAQSGR